MIVSGLLLATIAEKHQQLSMKIDFRDCLFAPIPELFEAARLLHLAAIAHCRGDSDSAAELIHRADMAMYQAKQRGKNQICFYNKGNICSDEEYFAQQDL